MDETAASIAAPEEPGNPENPMEGAAVAPLGARLNRVRRIAVLRAGGLGDLLFAVPAMRALAAAYPDAEVTLLGSPVAASLLAGRPGAPNRIIELPVVPGVGAPDDAPADPEEIERFLAARRDDRYDLAVQLHGGGRYSNAFLLELGAGCAIGARTADAAPLDRSIDYVYFQHEEFRWLEVAGLVGAAPRDLEPRIAVSAAELEAGRRHCGGGRPVAVVHPGATDPRRRWPAARFARVIAALARDGVRCLLVGDAGEQALCARIAAAARGMLGSADDADGGLVIDTAGALALPELVGVLAAADVVVANDSGPRHLAQAVGTRTVSIYWAGNLLNAGPLGRGRHRVHVSWTTRCPVCGRDVTQVGWTAERCEHDDSFVGDVAVESVLADARAMAADARAARAVGRGA